MTNLQARLCFELAFGWQSCSNTSVRNKNKDERWFVDERQLCLLQFGVPHAALPVTVIYSMYVYCRNVTALRDPGPTLTIISAKNR